MAISKITEKLLAAKKTKGISLAELEKVVGRDEVWIAAVIYRQAAASQEEAEKILSALEIDISEAAALTEPLYFGCGERRRPERRSGKNNYVGKIFVLQKMVNLCGFTSVAN
jgi:cyanate lyase